MYYTYPHQPKDMIQLQYRHLEKLMQHDSKNLSVSERLFKGISVSIFKPGNTT